MADRSLRGMRLGAQSLQSDEGVHFVARQFRRYVTDRGEEFEIPFAAEAEVPQTWESPKTGDQGRLLDHRGSFVPFAESEEKPSRTHWDMLLERRSREELEEILQERLRILRARRGHVQEE